MKGALQCTLLRMPYLLDLTRCCWLQQPGHHLFVQSRNATSDSVMLLR